MDSQESHERNVPYTDVPSLPPIVLGHPVALLLP